ncbi:hypothetical protein [Streptomyces cinereospinus]|uniref:DUF3558 domain-containing protein n=1 Tax=Streptomyces cinereospinus TaxID=285561 RepID=A0ABV5N0S7_9ACTN
MKSRRTPSRKRATVVVPVIAALLAALCGCGEEAPGRNYAVPAELCGIAVGTDDLAPFLPAGDAISVRAKSGGGVRSCQVVVDGRLVLTTTQAWLEEGRTTAYFAYGQSLEAVGHSAEDDRFRYSGNEAFGKTAGCVDSRYGQELYTAMQAQGSGHRDADAMKRLITSYTHEVESSAACDAGALT